MDLKEARILGPAVAAHWYYRSKAAAMTKLLQAAALSVILDVGAGSGYFSRYLLRRTTVSVACASTSAMTPIPTRRSGARPFIIDGPWRSFPPTWFC